MKNLTNNKGSFKWKLLIIILCIIVSVIMLGIFVGQCVQNKAIALDEQIQTATSEIKVQEKRRVDLIPNLVDCVKAYDKHEYDTLMAVVESRGVNDSVVSEVQTMIAAVAEAYPELKSNQNYKELMNELSTTENKIAAVRSNYNTCVNRYKAYTRQFPCRQILNMVGYEMMDYTRLDFNVSEDAPTDLFKE